MTARLVIDPVARAQARKADEWWRENRPKTVGLFATELQYAFGLIGDLSGAGVPVRSQILGLRRFLMSATCYHIYYRYLEDSDEVVVLAIWSAVRRRGPPHRAWIPQS